MAQLEHQADRWALLEDGWAQLEHQADNRWAQLEYQAAQLEVSTVRTLGDALWFP